jgi:hypothetical protein
MIQKLETEFIGTGEVKGFNFTQIERCAVGFIYEVENECKKHYEVFEHRKTPVCIDFEKRLYSEIDFKERYPKSNDFGAWAWTFNTLDKATKRFDMLKFN